MNRVQVGCRGAGTRRRASGRGWRPSTPATATGRCSSPTSARRCWSASLDGDDATPSCSARCSTAPRRPGHGERRRQPGPRDRDPRRAPDHARGRRRVSGDGRDPGRQRLRLAEADSEVTLTHGDAGNGSGSPATASSSTAAKGDIVLKAGSGAVKLDARGSRASPRPVQARELGDLRRQGVRRRWGSRVPWSTSTMDRRNKRRRMPGGDGSGDTDRPRRHRRRARGSDRADRRHAGRRRRRHARVCRSRRRRTSRPSRRSSPGRRP